VTATKETEWARRQRRERERAEHVATFGPACQICGNVPKRGLDQDHDHRSGVTRGWLCHRCNRALPVWVTPEWLFEAFLYLSEGARRDGSKRSATASYVLERLEVGP
jgi:hypothetical protein